MLPQKNSSSLKISRFFYLQIGAGMDVHIAVPMLMGANIGTSVTNTLVAMTQIGNRDEFERAFAAATVHDMFNWSTVILLFTVEVCTYQIIILWLHSMVLRWRPAP